MADLEQQPIESEDIEKVDVEEESTNLVTFRLGSGEYAIDNLEESEGDKNTGIIIAKIEDVDMGIMIDSVSKVVSISNSDIQPPPSMLQGIGQRYIKGVGKLEDKLLVVLDLDKLFTNEEDDDSEEEVPES